MVGQGAVVKAAIREMNSPGHATGADFGCKDSQPGPLGGGRGHDLVKVLWYDCRELRPLKPAMHTLGTL